MPQRMCAVPSVMTLMGLVDPEWHTDQLHRMGAGKNPDVTRGRLLTAVSAIKRNGFDAFRGERGTATAHKKRSQRFRVNGRLLRYLAEPGSAKPVAF